MIEDLLHKKVRVRGTKFPDGLIDIELTESFLKGLKLDIAGDSKFEDVLGLIFLAYKNSVSQKLQVLTEYLQTEYVEKVELAVERLAADTKSLLMGNLNAGRLADAVTTALINFRLSVNKVCGWLQVAHKDDLSQLFSMEQIVLIAVDYTCKVRVGFAPTIQTKFNDSDVKLTGHSLVVLVDALFILLDNVFWYAGGIVGRQVLIEVDVDEGERVIRLMVENDLAPFKNRAEIIAETEKARVLLSHDQGSSHMNDEKSGFPKLKQLSAQHMGKDALQFGLVDDKFRVKLVIPYASLGTRKDEASTDS